MLEKKDYSHVPILIIGGGPAGLSAAIAAKAMNKEIDVVVLEKGEALGNHNLSGAVMEISPLRRLLDEARPGWHEISGAGELFGREVKNDDVCFLLGKKFAVKISSFIRIAKKLGLSFGELDNHGSHIVSISELTKFLGQIATSLGIEVYPGFGAKEILYNQATGEVNGVRLVDQGLDREGHPQPNYVKGDVVTAEVIILAEGAMGLVTEDLVLKLGLKRRINQVFSVGVKEIIRVSESKYRSFGDNRVIHTIGYPLWFPVFGPGLFGGGFVYSYPKNQLAVGLIVGADWEYCNFNPQKALEDFKQHHLVKQFIEDGEVVEAGVKIIPEGGYYAMPRYPAIDVNGDIKHAIGYKNVMIVGDSAGLVNMHKIKGLHNAIESGSLAGKAAVKSMVNPLRAAEIYTDMLEQSPIMAEMKSARNFRSLVARFGPTIGLPLSVIGMFLPPLAIEKDYKIMASKRFRYESEGEFDKSTFVGQADTEHREEQPSHLSILDNDLCIKECDPLYDRPCIIFCPAGVYEDVHNNTIPANPSNCLHCKTCQIKCPFDNIRWTVPEGGGGPRYKHM